MISQHTDQPERRLYRRTAYDIMVKVKWNAW